MPDAVRWSLDAFEPAQLGLVGYLGCLHVAAVLAAGEEQVGLAVEYCVRAGSLAELLTEVPEGQRRTMVAVAMVWEGRGMVRGRDLASGTRRIQDALALIGDGTPSDLHTLRVRAWILASLAEASLELGDAPGAVRHQEAAVELLRELAAADAACDLELPGAVQDLGRTLARVGRKDEAADRLAEAEERLRRLDEAGKRPPGRWEWLCPVGPADPPPGAGGASQVRYLYGDWLGN